MKRAAVFAPLLFVLVLGPATVLASSPSQSSHAVAAAKVVHVKITQKNGKYLFKPHTIVVKAGTTIIWTNDSDVAHTVTEAHNKWTSPSFNQNKTYKRTFSKVGKYHYYCIFHAYMTGVVVVKKS